MGGVLATLIRRIPPNRAWVWSLLVCVLAAALEGALAGSEVTTRLTELLQPALSPPLWLWVFIALGYYLLFFLLLNSILGAAAHGAAELIALMLIAVLLAANALWNWLFFQKKDFELAFATFVPYLSVAIALALLLFRIGNRWRSWFLIYVAYLAYATWWMYEVWRLNERNAA